ncbi:hypothetical protein [Algivirga pacifica]|uniref:Uncharacterized protein n=1 Tax=Algivirga pacifica TaxID=1162670 RepID=A0ABP9DKE0_9BACT
MLRGFFLILTVCFAHWANSQQLPGNLFRRWVKDVSQPMQLQHPAIYLPSLQTSASDGTTLAYTYDTLRHMVSFHVPENTSVDSIQVTYRYFTVFSERKKHRVHKKQKKEKGVKQEGVSSMEPSSAVDTLSTQKGKVQTAGAISRGISAGNRQDVFVNSRMDLQLQGELTPDIAIKAKLTDQQIAYQPEGNTQQVQDLDQINLQLIHNNVTLEAGDILLQQGNTYFGKYNKNIEGAQVRASYEKDSTYKVEAQGTVSLAKGQYYREAITPIDGVQGPYRLRGPEALSYMIVIAGSEQVYIDGVKIQRGEDYVIDYNQAEVIFSVKVPITAYSRIQVEYEYALQVYGRSIQQFRQKQSGIGWEVYTDFYQEKDRTTQTLFIENSETDLENLRRMGDQVAGHYVSSIDTVEDYSDVQVLYTYADDGSGTYYLKRATAESSPFLKASFTNIGEGKGSYILDEITATGRVYRWVGEGMGAYEPVKQLVAPNEKQLLVVGGKVALTAHETLDLEWATSLQDLNLFSDLDDKDNRGNALKLTLSSSERHLMDRWRWKAHAKGELVDKQFRPVDRFLPVEFTREWDLPANFSDQYQIYTLGGEVYSLDQKQQYAVQWQQLQLKEGGAQRQELESKTEWKQWSFQQLLEGMQKDTEVLSVDWYRWNASLQWKNKWLQPIYQFMIDHNERKDLVADTLLRSTPVYAQHRLALQTSPSLPWSIVASYTHRNDEQVLDGSWTPWTKMQTYELKGKGKWGTQLLEGEINYRETDYLSGDSREEHNLMGKIAWQGYAWEKAVFNTLELSTSSGMELRREFFYVEVDNGRGTHTWRDLNNNGIKELGEFFLAVNPDERDYVKYFVPTNEYVPAYATSLNYKGRWRLPTAWQQEEGIKHWLSKWQNELTLRMEQKTTSSDWLDRLSWNNNQAQVLYQRLLLRNSLYWNKSNVVWEAGYHQKYQNNIQTLTSGTDERMLKEQRFDIRWNAFTTWTLEHEGRWTEIHNQSDYLPEQNFMYTIWASTPAISWQFNTSFRLKLTGEYLWKEAPKVDEQPKITTRVNKLESSLKYASNFRMNVEGSFGLTYIDFTGEQNTALAYEMMEALQQGTNYLWQLNALKQFENGLQLNVSYHGRKSGEQRIAHVGQVMLTANF